MARRSPARDLVERIVKAAVDAAADRAEAWVREVIGDQESAEALGRRIREDVEVVDAEFEDLPAKGPRTRGKARSALPAPKKDKGPREPGEGS